MNNFHYHQDPLYSAASRILEGVSDVEAIVADFAVGDNTNFGKVLEIGPDSITFKAKDLPKTRIAFKQRKMGSSEFLLTKLVKLKEETESSEESLDEAYKPLRKPEDLVAELQSIIDAPDAKLWDVTSVSIRLSHDDIFDRFPKIYPYVKDMWAAIMTPDGARKTKEIAKKAIEAVHKYYPIKEDVELEEAEADPKMQEIDKKIEALMKQRTELEAEDDDLQKYISSAIERDEARGNDPDENDSITTAKKELSDIQDKHAKVDSEIQKLRAEKKSMNEESDLSTLRQRLDKHSEEAIAANRKGDDEKVKYHQTQMNKIKERMANMVRNEEAETLDEAINWLGDYLPTSEKSQFGGYRPTIIDKKTKRVIYQSTVKYNTPDEAKDHAEDYLKQKSKGIKEPKVPRVGTYKEETEASEETLDEAINWLGDYLPTSEKSKFGGYLPMIINKRTKGLMYQSAAKYNTPQEAKDHAEDYLKQKSKGIKEPKVPYVGTYKEETEEEVTEAVDPATKRRKQLDMARVNAGAMSRDDYNKKYKLGKYRPAGSKPSGPGGLYKNLVKEVLNPEDDASVWIDDFVKSDDPRFAGKSKEERIKMALGAWYAAQKKESVEQSAESLEEATMNAAEKKMAQEIHKVFKDGEQVSQAYAMRIRDMRKQLIKKFGNNWRQKAGITEEGAESLEEVVALPSVKKVIDMVDEMSPKEYSNFLHALADNAFGIAVSTKRVKPNGPSNSDAWEDVADGIRDAAKAYDARPVKMSEGAEELEEAAIYPLTKKALNATFELDSDEFEEFLKELTMYFNKTGDKTGYNEYFQVGDHLEKAYKIWKGRDPDAGLDYGI